MSYYVTLDDLEKRVTEISSISPFGASEIIDENYVFGPQKTNLSIMKQNAEQQLKSLLAILGYSGEDTYASMAQLNARIQEFQGLTEYFNGPALRDAVINPIQGKLVNMSQLKAQKYDEWLAQHCNDLIGTFQKVVNNIAQEMNLEPTAENVGEIINEVFLRLNYSSPSGSISVKQPTGGRLLSNDTKELAKNIMSQLKKGMERERDPNFLALVKGNRAENKNFRRRLFALAKAQLGEEFDDWIKYPEDMVIEGDFSQGEDGRFQLYTDFTNLFTQYMTPANGIIAETAARNFFETKKNDAAFMEEFYNAAESYFMSYVNNSGLQIKNREYLVEKLRQAIRHIATTYPAAFFPGANTQGVIGIFGEIQALFYIYALLGENSSLNPETVASWIGGIGGGIKTGADVLISIGEHIGYGIQVKNSMSLGGSTSFSDFALNSGYKEGDRGFVDQLIGFGLPRETVDAIEDLLTMETFNIPYHLEGQRAVEGHPKIRTEEYNRTRDEITRMYNQANKLMVLAAATIMRIRYLEEQDITSANTLFIIGGTLAISAAQILDNLIKQIKGEIDTVFKVRTKTALEGKEGKYTIINWINDGRHNIDGLKTTLSTSYNFHK